MKKIIIISIFIASQVYFIHFLWKDSFILQQKIYPIESFIALHSVDCSDNIDKDIFVNIIKGFGSLKNQIVLYKNNKQIHCETGWQGFPLLSEKINSNNKFRIASLTKIFSSYEILKLSQNNKLELQQPWVNYFPELSNQFVDSRIKTITIEQMLSHKSGFDRLRSLDVVMEKNIQPWCEYDIAQINQKFLDFTPGEYYAYDNRNTCLLGKLLQKQEQTTLKKIFSKYNFDLAGKEPVSREVVYDFRFSREWGEYDNKKFNYGALASSAGVVTSALNFSNHFNKIINSRSFDLKDLIRRNKCKEREVCGNTGLYYVRYKNHDFLVKQGYLPSALSWLIYNDNGDYIVWFGSSSGKKDSGFERENIKFKLMDMLLVN